MDSISELQMYIGRLGLSKNIYNVLTRVCIDWYGFYCQIMKIPCNFNTRFAMQVTGFVRTCFIRRNTGTGIQYSKAALIRSITTMGPKFSLYSLSENEIFCGVQNKSMFIKDEDIEVLCYNKNKSCFIPVKDLFALEMSNQGKINAA